MDDEENGERLDQPGPEADEAPDQQVLVPTAVRQVNFHGDVITVVLVEERGRRQVYVLLRPLCQYLGLSWSSQLQRLREGHEPPHYMRGLANRPLREGFAGPKVSSLSVQSCMAQ